MKKSLSVVAILLYACLAWGQESYISGHIGELIQVPGGSFQRDKNPENISTVGSFSMSRYPITSEQFTTVTGYPDYSFFKRIPDSPVETVNWYTAAAFCNYLSILEGLEPVYAVGGKTNPSEWTGRDQPQGSTRARNEVTAQWDADGYRLPTEMEWMWTAMGADTDAPGEINRTGYLKAFAGDRYGKESGIHVDDYAWHRGNSDTTGNGHRSPQPVGTKKPNELGLHDMSGNVMEWCWDRRGPSSYPDGHLVDYRGPEEGSRIIRGGSWDRGARDLSVTRRTSTGPNLTFNWVGFRVVRR